MIDCFLGNNSAKYYENPKMLSQVTAKTSGMFFETQCIMYELQRTFTKFR